MCNFKSMQNTHVQLIARNTLIVSMTLSNSVANNNVGLRSRKKPVSTLEKYGSLSRKVNMKHVKRDD